MRCTVAASAADAGPEPEKPGYGPGAGYASRCHSGATKKWILSFTIGPPSENPNCFC